MRSTLYGITGSAKQFLFLFKSYFLFFCQISLLYFLLLLFLRWKFIPIKTMTPEERSNANPSVEMALEAFLSGLEVRRRKEKENRKLYYLFYWSLAIEKLVDLMMASGFQRCRWVILLVVHLACVAPLWFRSRAARRYDSQGKCRTLYKIQKVRDFVFDTWKKSVTPVLQLTPPRSDGCTWRRKCSYVGMLLGVSMQFETCSYSRLFAHPWSRLAR